MPAIAKNIPEAVRVFSFHGIELSGSGDQQAGDCPFCGREGKLGVKVSTGEWRCRVCEAKGNLVTFLREIWRVSDEKTNGQSDLLAADRKLEYPETLTFWGAAVSAVTGEWLVPGYDSERRLVQLYKYIHDYKSGKKKLLPTPGMGGHGIHLGPWDDAKRIVYVCEGPWDGMALWETLRGYKRNDDGQYAPTGNEAASLLADANVCAIPGCGSVGEPLKKWLPLFKGKEVILCFDSDHPREVNHKLVEGAGINALKRAAVMIGGDAKYIAWGPDGYDPNTPSGWDVRDALTTAPNKSLALGELLLKIRDVPKEWLGKKHVPTNASETELMPLACRSWNDLIENGWKKAMRWRQSLDDAFSVMMAVALSTSQQGDQIFLQVVADPGSGKTRLCDGMLVSKHCFALEHLTGFHSGWKGEGGEDYSLIARINHKTLITPEGDVVMASPNAGQIMSQQRRIFDGTSGATYKNRKEDLRQTGLRTPWILVGTPALLGYDQSRLGDRFIRIFIPKPDETERKAILSKVFSSAWDSVTAESDGKADTFLAEDFCVAYRLTGGYVDYLRLNANELIAGVRCDDPEALETRITELAEFTAAFRARPDPDVKKETHDSSELPTRLMSQYTRLARCLAATLNKPTIDAEVLRRVCKVAIDTARGHSMEIGKILYGKGAAGIWPGELCILTGRAEDREMALLRFLRRIKVVESFGKPTRWRLTERVRHLWQAVIGV